MKTKIPHFTLFTFLFITLNVFAQKHEIKVTKIDTPNQYRNDSFIITFDQPMQRIESDKIPISIKPSLKCYWTWIDHKNLSCSLNDYTNRYEDEDYDYNRNKKLQTATTYNIKFKKGLFDTHNNPLKAQTKKFTFKRPALTNFNVIDWKTPELPIISLNFNQKINERSLKGKMYLKADNSIISLRTVTKDEVPNKHNIYISGRNKQFNLVIPNQPLLKGLKYKIHLNKGVIGFIGNAPSNKSISKATIQAHDDFKFLSYTCQNTHRWKSYEGPCYADDRIELLFTSSIDKDTAFQCQDRYKYKIHTRTLRNNTSLLILSPESNQHNRTNLELLSDCIDNLQDKFGRKITPNKDKPTIKTIGYRPTLELNLPQNTLLTDKDEIKLYATSLNLDKFYLHIDTINHKPIDKTFTITTDNKIDKKIETLLPLSLPEKDIQAISGYISINQTIDKEKLNRWDSKAIVFNIQKSPYLINFRHNANFAGIQISDIYTAKPIKNTKLTIFQGEKPYHTKTDAKGKAQIKLNGESISSNFAVQLKHKNKTTKLTNINSYYNSINKKSHYNENFEVIENSFDSYGLTDKPVYRPGEKVKFKFYLRQKKDKHYVIPTQKQNLKVYVSYRDSDCWDSYDKCHSFYVKEVNQLDDFGGFSDEFTLPKNIANGSFGISYRIKNETDGIDYTSSVTFQVSNFKNSDYKLNLESHKQYVKGREKVPVVATASYYSGGYVPDEKGEIAGNITEKDIREVFPKYEDYNFGEFEGDYTSFFLKDLNFDNKGEIHAGYIPPKSDIEFGELKLNAGLKPKNGEWNYSSNLIFPYRQKDYFLGLKFSSWALQIDKTISLENILIDYMGKEHKSNSINYQIKHKSQRNQWPNYEALTCQNKELNSCQFKLSEAGRYIVLATANYKGEIFKRVMEFYVINPYSNYVKTDKPKIEIVADKPNYEIGDTANITLKFPYPKIQAYITTERNSILNSWVKKTKKGLIKLRLKITEKHAPGFDISALIQQPDKVNSYNFLSHIENNSLTIQVKEPKKYGLFSITADKEIYAPKERVNLTINSNSETSSNYVIAVIDQSIVDLVDSQYLYDLSELSYSQAKYYWQLLDASQLSPKDSHNTKIILSRESIKFEQKDNDYYNEDKVELSRVVTTGTSIRREDLGAYPNEVNGVLEKPSPVFSINREQKQAFIGNMFINKHDLRTLFADSAFFKSDVTIGANGELTISFNLPDNITQWNIIVLGTDKSGHLEFNKTAIKASKDLELRSTLPLQVTQGDSFSAEFAVVSKKDTTVDIQAAAEIKQNNLALNTLQTSFENVDKLKSQTFSLPVEKVKNGDLDVIALVKIDNDADGIRQNIAVRPAQIELSTSQFGQFDGATKTLNFKQPKNLANNSAQLSLHVSNSLLPNLNPVYNFIHDYPHTCWEQQSAKAIITAIEAVSDKKLTPQQIAEKKNFVQNILNGAQDFQAGNGGMTFFKASNEHVNLFLSLYTLDNFEFLQDLGYHIPKNVYQQLKAFSKKILLKVENIDTRISRFEKGKPSPEIQLMALKHVDILNKTAITKIKQNLFAKKEDLNLFALNHLLRAYQGEPGKQEQILSAISDKFYSYDKKFTPKTNAYSYWYLLPSDNKNQCDLISSQLKLEENLINKDDLLKHINGVLDRRNAEGDFGSTLENSYCAKALYEFSQKYERQISTNDYHFTINKKEINGYKNALETTIDLGQDLKVEINNSLSQQSYYSTTLKYPVKPGSIKAQNHGFNLQRQYFIFNDGKWQQAKQFRTGDWVKTVLTIHSPIGRKFVAVSNPVPGGWLPTDTALARNMPVGIRESEKSSDNSYYFYERQLNPATTRFYADYLPAGSYNISYYSQIRNAGTFIAMPAIVEEMYDDENRATTTRSIIKITKNQP